MVGRLIVLVFLTLSIIFSTTIEGRKLLTATNDNNNSISSLSKRSKEAAAEVAAALRGREIGSRPPRCEGRCKSCGHCEAVQVPTTISISVSNIEYKPITWKCKCGSSVFNP
ncbi:EPIDERMAL PATTERNING FACTOR-like protein 2 [Chenopodium quinoa]|uniref:EPIDERMAL PATTERNING FACTOR-like protein 2 n=1 Tax=Chenopodium quinoa TaxID=63459 RepID=UPI000B793B39|nr:EPIDERMAL PATTERNING FACTOR-like protein 2 [Chenopodium quinoa]